MSFLGREAPGTTVPAGPPRTRPGWRRSELLSHALVYGRSTWQPREDVEFNEERFKRNRSLELIYVC